MIVAVMYGGRSCEHDVSIITALQAMSNMPGYEVYPVYMKEGAFYTGEALLDIDFYLRPNMKKCVRLWLIDGMFYGRMKNVLIKKFKPDVALICCHGGEGENGVLQGVLEYNRIPYTSASVMASAVSMDKIISKQLTLGLLYNAVDEIAVRREDFTERRAEIIRHIETFLDYPVIVKPSSLGSSIGIKTAKNSEELQQAIEIAANFDRKIIVERALVNFTEINCAVVGDGDKTVVSEIEQPLSWQEFLTFEDKYLSGGKGMQGEARRMPADVSAEMRNEVRETSKRLYLDLDMAGVVRIDYLLSENGKLYVNEINTIPGSLAFYLFEPVGICPAELIKMMINSALRRFNENKKSKLAFNSSILRNFGGVKQLPKYR